MTKARLEDLAAAAPMIVFYSFAVCGFGIQIAGELSKGALRADLIMSMLVKLPVAAFACAQIVFFIVRKLPVAKFAGLLPRIAAVAGSNVASLLVLLPSANRAFYLRSLSSMLIVAGTVGSVFVICRLGKAFSITPQARVLVTSGPYSVIRHPLYLTETISTFGVMLLYREPWALLVFALATALQLARIHWEEEILLKTFPAYKAYAAATARLVPGIY